MARENEPAYIIEQFIDKYSLAKVCDMLAGICGEKANHIYENWQDEPLGRKWDRAGEQLHNLATKFRGRNL